MEDEELLLVNSEKRIDVTRFLHTQKQIRDTYGKEKVIVSWKDRLREKFKCSGTTCLRTFLSYIPFINVIRTYKLREYILGDILSGITAACLHFPQGLAFGILASLAPAFGLYTSFFPIVLYMFFGTSHHTSFGTNAVIALFTAEIVEAQVSGLVRQTPVANVTGNDTQTVEGLDDDAIMEMKVMAASGASLIVGIVLLVMGILRLGFLTSYMSSSFIHAFVCASAFHIATSQIPKALGISIPLFTGPGKLVLSYIEIFKAIPNINVASLIITILSMAILLLVKECINKRFKDKMKMPIPIDLILIVIATIISHFANFKDVFAVPVVGNIPSGIPAPRLPVLSSDYVGTAIIVAILVFVLSIAMARTCELKHDYQIDDNQELVAYGISNLGSSFFQCFPSCTAPPRTMLLSLMDAKTTLNGLFSAVVMLLVLMVIGQLFESLPLPVLSAMVIIAVKDLLLHVTELPNFWRINGYDFVIWMGTCLCGVFIDIPYGLYAGVGLGLLTIAVQSQRSASYTLSTPKDEDIYLDSSMHRNLHQLPNIRIFRMEASLYFATSAIFKNKLYKEVCDPRQLAKSAEMEKKNGIEYTENGGDEDVTKRPQQELKYLVIDCSLVSYVDINGMKVLAQITKEFRKVNVTVVLARCSRYMLKSLDTSILSDVFTDNRVFLDLNDAIYACKHSLV
ncbi:solute carrier family 26 member 10-like isoform X2 [Mizuhopecten yessoensis]|nr:solute carrier family 26 member 10-like isoform X2 [Mizuhopecten yessoensis]XP_021369022.1 solute carrier family 26 member 10-like isoform X2 [Mizuhopecten yessoensis]